MKKRMMALVVVLVMVVTTLAMSGFVMAEEQEVLSNNLFVCDNFAEYLTTNSVTAPFNFTDPVTGAIGSMAGDSYAIAETVGTETYAKLSYSKAGHGFSSFFAFWDGTDSASVVGGKLVKGNYKVVLTVRGGGTAFATDNWGWRLVGSGSPDGALILGEKDNIKDIVADANGWKSVVVYVNVTTDTCDSFSMWYNTLSKDSAESNAQIKSVSVQRVIPQLSVVGDTEFDKAQPKDLAYTVDLAGNVFTSLSYLGDNLIKDTDYTLTGNALVIKKEFLSKLSAGAQDLLLTAGTKVATISIEIIPIQPTIPSADGYDITNGTVNGDFEAFKEEQGLTLEQLEGAWGALDNYDDAGKIISKDGSKTLRLMKHSGSSKIFSSAFVMVPPDWEIGDIVTLKFDYKYEQGVGEPNNIFNIAFTGAQNKPNHEINLSNIGAKTGGDSRFKWDITSSALTGARADWKHVEVTFVVDSQFKIQCDSLRFLMNISGDNADDVAYFDNVGMYTWAVKGAVDETPVISGEKSKTFTKSSPADISFTIDTKGNTISSIKRGTSNLNASAFTATETSFTLKKEYLSTLDVGTHTFTVNTLGGTVNFTIVVEQGATGCCSSVSVLGMGLMLVALFGVVAIIIAERKHSKKA